MKIFFNLTFLLLLAWSTSFAQSADPAISGATFTPNTIKTGETATLEFSFVNSGFDPIPTNSIEITVVTANTFYKTDGTNAPAGVGASLFDWVHINTDGVDVWRGSNNTVIDAFGGGPITLEVTGIAQSSAFETTNINVQLVDNFGDFSNESSNDNEQPSLKIDQGSGNPCEAQGGVGATCIDAYGNTSTVGTDCQCIDLGPCYTQGGVGTTCTIGGQVGTIDANCDCIPNAPTCTEGDPCTDSDGDASTVDASCNCIEIDNGGVGTEADPAVTGATYTPNEIEVGAKSTLNISFANTGSSAIPANSIELTIVTANAYYASDGSTEPSGLGASLFDWTHISTGGIDVWRGINNTTVAAFGGGDILLEVMGMAESPSFETTNINVQLVDNFGKFKNESSNDNLQPALKVVQPPVNCEVSKPLVTLNSSSNPTCAGGSNGSIDISVSYPNGVGSESWLWNGGQVNAQDLDGLSAGTYNFTAIDLEGCSATLEVVLEDPAPVVVSASNVADEACTTFGSVQLSASGGTAPYTFEGTLTAATQDGNITGLSAGDFTVMATDAKGCESAVINVTIGNNCGCIDKDKDGVCAEDDCDDDNPNIKYGPGDACDDGRDCTENDRYNQNCECEGTLKNAPVLEGTPAEVEITVSCETIPSPPVVTAGVLDVVYRQERSGDNDCNYILTRTWKVDDGCGNVVTYTQIITVTDEVAPVLVGVPGDITVNVNNGESIPAIDVTATDNCDPNPTVNFAEPSILPDPCSNQITYSQTWSATDACGNTSESQTRTITIIDDNFFQDADGDGVCDPDDICPGFDDSLDADNDGTPDGCEQCDGSLTIVLKEQKDVSCNGGTDGKLVIEIRGGTGPYSTSWTNGPNTVIYSGLQAGTYTAAVKDVNDCQTTATFTIDEPTPVKVDLVAKSNQNCDLNTGSIDIEVSGGTAPYTYRWNNAGFSTTQDLIGLNARNNPYIVEIEDANGCKTTASYQIDKDCGCDNVTEGGRIGFGSNCTLTPTICAGLSSPIIGSCELPSGGSGTLEYIWFKSTDCPNRPPRDVNDPDWMIITDSDSPTLQIGTLTETTCFIRCARRIGCEDYLGESNIVKVIVNPDTKLWYADKDKDGFGDPEDSKMDCEQPDGYVMNSEDCDDNNNSIPTQPGSICDDGNPNTINDQILGDGCTCRGQDDIPTCPTPQIIPEAGQLTITGLTAPINAISIFAGRGNTLIKSCGPCEETYKVDLAPGTYRVFIQFRDANNAIIPDCGYIYKTITIEALCVDDDKDGVCNPDDICPNGDDNADADGDGIPDACDDCDGNLAGKPCNDGDDCTTNDVYDANCNCSGTFADTDSDGVCDTDDICPNGDDKADADGDGIPDACDDCDNRLAGTPCDDGNPTTENDVYDADCNCVGTPVLNCDIQVTVLNITNPTCVDRNNGIIAVQPSNGVAPYKIEWSNGRTNVEGLTGLYAGDYSISIMDAVGCMVVENYTLANPEPITVNENIVDATCNQANGSISIEVAGGTGNYKYFWNGFESTKNQENLAAGTYTLQVRDENYCQTEFTFEVKNITTADCNPVGNVIQCDKATLTYGNGNLKIEVSPDNANYRFVIHELPTYAVNSQSCDYTCGASFMASLPEGKYLIRVYDGNEWRTPFCETEIEMGGNTGGCTDKDNDGICLEDDCDDNNPSIGAKRPVGSSCDDGNANTENDRIQSDGCSCIGTPIITDPCAAKGGDKDEDGICQDDDCDDNNPNIGAKRPVGSSCDDGNANTTNDVILSDGCSCAGTPKGSGDPTVCDIDINVIGSNLYVAGTDEPYTKIEIYRGYYAEQLIECGYFEDCDDPFVLSDLPIGQYTIKVQSYYATAEGRWIEVCFVEELVEIKEGDSGCIDTDGDGICQEEDCDDNNPNIGRKQATGTSCDDGNANTTNDVIQADGCSCSGTPITIDPCAAKGGDEDGDGVCRDDDCDDNNPNIGRKQTEGTGCDDGNANTTNDVIQADGCSCAGTPINTGNPCDAVTATAGIGSITVDGLTSPNERLKLYRLGNNNALTLIDNCTGNCGDSWFVDGLAAGDYVILFTLVDENWGSICSEDDVRLFVTINDVPTTGRNSNLTDIGTAINRLKVYPNPARDEVFINLSNWNNETVDLIIHNHLSQVVFEQHIEQVNEGAQRIDLSTFTNGIYYIRVKAKGQKPITKKILVSKLY